jgi:ribose transport system substrate-binding protein
MRTSTIRRLIAGGLCALAAATAAAGCGSNSESESSGASSSSGQAASDVTASTKAVDAGYAGTFREPPTGGPAAQKGKDVWVISCQQAAGGGCYNAAKGLTEAGKLLGWNVKTIDGQGDPGRYNAGVRQAIAARASAIVLDIIDCPSVKSSLAEAQAAKIPVIGVASVDCDDPLVGGKAMFTANASWGKSIAAAFRDIGAGMADYMIAKTDGKAKIAQVTANDYLIVRHAVEGFDARIKSACPDCKIVASIDQPVAGLSNGQATHRIQTMLQQHPEANALAMPYDAMVQVIGQMLKSQSRKDLITVGLEGYPPNMKLIREGTQTATVGWSSNAAGWAGADVVNRVLAGEKDIPDEGLGYRIVDKDHNTPTDPRANWQPNTNYIESYTKAWTSK